MHVDGDDFQVHAAAPTAAPFPVPVLLGALAPRMLRVAGEVADGTVTWMANREALESHVVPRITAAAASAGRPAPRVVVGPPGRGARRRRRSTRSGGAAVRVLRQPAELRARSSRIGGLERSADACIVGDEDAVAAQLRALVDAGATDVWAAIFPVGDDRRASRVADARAARTTRQRAT